MGLSAVCLFITAYLLFCTNLVHSHGGHDHHHHDGDAIDDVKFRYSKAANDFHDHHHDDHANGGSHGPGEASHRHSNFPRDGYEKLSSDGYSRNALLLQAISATVLISAVPFLILFFIPLEKADAGQPLLKVLLSFAAGGLLGDAFLHLIPHAILQQDGGHDHDHSSSAHAHDHDHGDHGHSHDLSVGLWVLAGIVTFLLVEKFVRIVKGGHHHHHHAHDDVALKAEESPSPLPVSESDDAVEKKREVRETRDGAGKSVNSETVLVNRKITSSAVKSAATSRGSSVARDAKSASDTDVTDEGNAEILSSKSGSSRNSPPPVHVIIIHFSLDTLLPHDVKVAAYLNLAADFTHNFTDGLAIGASFLRGSTIGTLTTLSILLHEIPHEIGDFAILIQSGCGKKKAIMLQLVTAVGALSGTITSFLAEEMGEKAPAWILPFTAGGFIYIATVSVLPELLEGVTNVKQSIMEILALLLGVYMMVLIAQYE
ncbi:unnamed protein product [Notodromas monacha]|uniref:Solute carrier family 39 member 7 n=1 Tax=Notodromas monacha TaxID=399045 RepID=A0A7R9BU77_9CRUS|nr:unnamed protein product [Notodromas monacha]CAG0920765.1 unnamed protein product [Notodromas monacha]